LQFKLLVMTILVLWCIKPCRLVYFYRYFCGAYYFIDTYSECAAAKKCNVLFLQDHKIATACNFTKSVTFYQSTKRNIPEEIVLK